MAVVLSDFDTEPFYWLVVFHLNSTRWVSRLCPGKFKHVSAVGFVPHANAWLHVSWEMGRLRVEIVPDDDLERWLATLTVDAAVLHVKAPSFDAGPWHPRLGVGCCGAIAHLLGLPCNPLWPDQLWRALIRRSADIACVVGKPAVSGMAAGQ